MVEKHCCHKVFGGDDVYKPFDKQQQAEQETRIRRESTATKSLEEYAIDQGA
jgi:hypothetical protein